MNMEGFEFRAISARAKDLGIDITERKYISREIKVKGGTSYEIL